MIIRASNSLHITAPKTFLSATEAAGTTTLRVRNSAGMSTSWAVQLGEIGQEQTEVVIGTAPNSGTITCATTSFEHPADTPVYMIKYNQVVFEKSTSGTSGTASPITNGTIGYQADSNVTIFDDTAGAATHAYRTYLLNSVTAGTTSESDWSVPGGYSFYSLAGVRDRVKEKLWNATFIKEDKTIDNWINEWKDKMSNAVIKVNENYAMGTTQFAFGTNGLGTITTADFKSIRRLWVTYNGVGTVASQKSDPNDFYPDQVLSSSYPRHMFHGDSVFEVKPPESGGTAFMEFYRFGTTLVNDTDELPLPMRSYTDSFVDYALSQALFKDGRTQDSQTKLADANTSKNDFVLELSPRDRSGPTVIDIVEAINAEDGML